MNILSLIKFKKKFGQNYLLFIKKYKFDLCSGFNFFNFISNDIEYNKNCFCKNKIYLFLNNYLYKNFLFFFFKFYKIININLPFNTINFFIKKYFKIKKKIFKIIIQEAFIKKIRFTSIIKKIKIFKKNIFFPFTNIKIVKIYCKKNLYLKFINKKLIFKTFKSIKSFKILFLMYKILIKFNKNVFCNKI